MTEKPEHSMLEAAKAEVRAAFTLVADPQVDNGTSSQHLLAAWRATAKISRGGVPESANKDLSGWLSAEHVQLVPEKKLAAVHRTLAAAMEVSTSPAWEPLPEGGAKCPKAAELLGKLRALDGILDGLSAQGQGQSLRWRRRARWLFRATMWSGAVGLFVVVALRPWQYADIGNWRASYYASTKFDGEPDTRREVDVDHKWGKEPPTDSIPSDGFAARWDTCLIVDERVDAAFMVVADDGARVFLDGKEIVNKWKAGSQRVKGKRLKVKKGTHHLRVEYFEKTGRASMQLTASFDKREAPTQIPSSMLQFPGMKFPVASNPCETSKKKNKKKEK